MLRMIWGLLLLWIDCGNSQNWIQPCGPNGVVNCSKMGIPSDQSELLGNNLLVADCTYIGCPPIVIDTGANVTLRNITFRNSLNNDTNLDVGGGAIYVKPKATATLVNCKFFYCEAVTHGGAV